MVVTMTKGSITRSMVLRTDLDLFHITMTKDTRDSTIQTDTPMIREQIGRDHLTEEDINRQKINSSIEARHQEVHLVEKING